MSLTADDGIRVYVDGEDVTGKVLAHPATGGWGSASFDISPSDEITVMSGDSIEFTWTESGAKSSMRVEPLAALSGRWRVTRDGPAISAEDWKIIDSAIIESVARGHARRL